MVSVEFIYSNPAEAWISLVVESDNFTTMTDSQLIALGESLRKEAILGPGYEGGAGYLSNVNLRGLGRAVPLP